MDAASLWLLTVAVADESAIRHTVWHPQWAEAAIFNAELIVGATGKLVEILWLVSGNTVMNKHKHKEKKCKDMRS